jgi:DNA-binding transcriptional regulator PaaX
MADGTSEHLPDERGRWLLLVYRIPSEPTRLRASAWRRLRSLGAIYLQNGVAALAYDPSAERALRKLRRDILQMEGSAVLLRCHALAGETGVVESFKAARGEEYEEIVDKCHDFLVQVKKEHEAEHFSFAELEENEVDLLKLRGWFAKVSERDVFNAPGHEDVEALLAECEVALEGYAAKVYELDPDAG